MPTATLKIVPVLFTYKEAAAKLRVSEITMRRWVCKGEIRCKKIGGKVFFTEEQLAAKIVDQDDYKQTRARNVLAAAKA